MKKKVLAMFLTGLMAVSTLAGCGSKTAETPAQETGADEAGSEEGAAEEKITATITVWGPQEDQDEGNG